MLLLLKRSFEYDISNFDIKALFQTVVNRSPLKTDSGRGAAATSQGEPRSLELRSVANTYYRFLTSDLEREINGKRIGDMFACTRNHDKYKFLAKGYVLMELKYKNCYWGTRGEDNHLSMYCIFPRTKGEDDSPKIRWQLSFTDPNVLDEVEYQVHKTLHSAYCKKYTEAKNAGKEVIIAVLGNWEGRKCRIYSAKQISIVKPETRNNM